MYVFVRVNTAFKMLYILSSSTACFGRFWPSSGRSYNKIFVCVVWSTWWCPKMAETCSGWLWNV